MALALLFVMMAICGVLAVEAITVTMRRGIFIGGRYVDPPTMAPISPCSVEPSSNDEFEQIIKEVINTLSDDARNALNNIVILVEPEHPTALGYFHGTPLIYQRGFHPWPNEIVLCEGPIRRYVATGHDLKAVIHDVILHELGHYFGLTHHEMGATVQA